MINSPHNPTGSVLNESDMGELENIVRDTNILIISDEVYEHLIFDSLPHQSVLKFPSLYQRSFVCFSFGKVYNCTGWKLGYCVAPEWLTQEFRKIHQFNCFSCDTPKQVALSIFLSNRDEYLRLGTELQKKRDYFVSMMLSTRLKPLPSHGSYFQIYSYDRVSDEPEKEFAARLTKENKVATIPVSAFYLNGQNHRVLRFCFSKNNSTLEEAARRLQSL
jgi:methionine aminotransferase